jgi:hypothetical protein
MSFTFCKMSENIPLGICKKLSKHNQKKMFIKIITGYQRSLKWAEKKLTKTVIGKKTKRVLSFFVFCTFHNVFLLWTFFGTLNWAHFKKFWNSIKTCVFWYHWHIEIWRKVLFSVIRAFFCKFWLLKKYNISKSKKLFFQISIRLSLCLNPIKFRKLGPLGSVCVGGRFFLI